MSETIPLITAARLRERLNYDPTTGLFTWLTNRRSTAIGSVAGTPHIAGYVQINIDRRLYLAHRLAVLYMTGDWPTDLVDHENLNRADNRWSNIRQASHSQNHINTRVYRNNRLGVKGVSLHETGKFVAQIQVNGKFRYLGLYATAVEAKAAYDRAAELGFGEFARSV